MIEHMIIVALYIWGVLVSYMLWRLAFVADTWVMSVFASVLWPVWPVIGVIVTLQRKITTYITVWRR